MSWMCRNTATTRVNKSYCFYVMGQLTLPKPRGHDDVIKWGHFPRYWAFVRWIYRSQRAVTGSFDVFFDLRLNKRLSKQSRAGDLRRHRAHYDINVMNWQTSTILYLLITATWQLVPVHTASVAWFLKWRLEYRRFDLVNSWKNTHSADSI